MELHSLQENILRLRYLVSLLICLLEVVLVRVSLQLRLLPRLEALLFLVQQLWALGGLQDSLRRYQRQ